MTGLASDVLVPLEREVLKLICDEAPIYDTEVAIAMEADIGEVLDRLVAEGFAVRRWSSYSPTPKGVAENAKPRPLIFTPDSKRRHAPRGQHRGSYGRD